MSEKPVCEKLEKQVLKMREAGLKHKKAKDLLEDEIRWRRIMFEQSRDGLVVLDQNGKVNEANNLKWNAGI